MIVCNVKCSICNVQYPCCYNSRIVEIVIAQLVEHLYVKQETSGSTPGFGQHFPAIGE